MRKFLMILTLLILSVQTSFASVSSYCQEELVPSAHFAHHEHENLVVNASANDSSSFDSDCSVCHLAHSPALHSTFSISIASTISHFEDSQVEFLVDISPVPPEKPNWLALG